MSESLVPGFDPLVRRRCALARIDIWVDLRLSPNHRGTLKIHVFPQGNHREGPGVRFPTTSGIKFPSSSPLHGTERTQSVVIANLVLEVPGSIPGADRNPFSTLTHPVSILDPVEERI